jgi:hypothetical protein
MSNEYQEYMQMLADNAARVRGASKTGVVRQAENPYKYQQDFNDSRRHYSASEEALAKVTEGKADPGDISKMAQAYDPGFHQREEHRRNLESWEIERQMERERILGSQVK